MLNKTSTLFPNDHVTLAVMKYCRDHSLSLPEHVRNHYEHTLKQFPDTVLMIEEEEAQFLLWFVKAQGAKKILEIGCFTGFSAMIFAEALKDVEGAKIVTTEINPKAIEIARKAFAEAGKEKIITLLEGPALESLSKAQKDGPFDFIFLDANKDGYEDYFKQIMSMGLLRRGGILVADNVLKRGLVADHSDANPASGEEDQMKNARYLIEFNKLVAADDRVEAVILPVFDGLTFARLK